MIKEKSDTVLVECESGMYEIGREPHIYQAEARDFVDDEKAKRAVSRAKEIAATTRGIDDPCYIGKLYDPVSGGYLLAFCCKSDFMKRHIDFEAADDD